MALRHPFSGSVLPSYSFPVEPERAPVVARRPKEVKFRTGADIDALVKDVMGYTGVRLAAAVGAGKSTKVPLALAKGSGLPVIHVVPSRLLAVALFDYLSKNDPAGYHLSLEPTDPIGRSNVTITYSANVCAILMAKGMDAAFQDFEKGVILFLDECHESDAYTYTLAAVAQLIGGVKSVVSSSATYSADRMPMSEPHGTIESQMFSKEDKPSTWDPLDASKPWSVAKIGGNALIYLDSEQEAKALVSKYNQAGASAFRLSARMPVSAFRDAMRVLNDPRSGIVVLVADYSFRSGFTFDIQVIIDSGIVQYYDVVDGQCQALSRRAYELERYQAQGRGARIPGSSCVYYQPPFKAESAICLLEGVEMDASAVMFRCLGYAVPAQIKTALMAVGNVPVDFASAVNGGIPLALLGPDQLQPLVVTPSKPSSIVADDISVKDVLGSYMEDTPPDSPIDFFTDAVKPFAAHAPIVQGDGLAFLQQLRMMSGQATTLLVGRYYACAGLPNEDVLSRLYGEDWRQALREILKNPHMVSGFEIEDRLELVAQFLVQYNRAVAQQNGITQMLASQDSLRSLMTRYPNHVKEWSEYVGQALREAESDSRSLLKAIEHLRTNDVRFVPLDPDIETEGSVAKAMAARLLNAVSVLTSQVDTEGYKRYVRSKLDSIEPSPDDKYEKLSVRTVGGEDETASFRVLPCRSGKKAMQDIEVRVDRSITWSEAEYKVAVMKYLQTMGLSVSSIRNVAFIGSRVSPDRVMQQLRDMGDFSHRVIREFRIAPKSKQSRLITG